MPEPKTYLVPGAEPERGLCVVVVSPGTDPADELNEISELMRTAGVEPVGEIVQHRAAPDPRTFIGKGKLAEVKTAIKEETAETVIVDDDLDPSQQRRLEDELGVRVVDRTQLILDIFAQHAVTAEGKLQVELAQLDYNLPRMRGMWAHLERLGGGAGAGRRGPGESQLETDRRLARARISVLKKRLKELGLRRATQRKERRQAATPLVALAGYTNAGKSTLLNRLTNADVSVNDRLFETLDPTTRAFEQDGRRYLVTDTVGFIRRLPHGLVEGFAATLEETLLADLILHVVDASAPDPRLADTIRAVEDVLAEIDATHIPQELVLNKIDSLDGLSRRRLAEPLPGRRADLRADRGGARPASRAGRGSPRRPVRAGAPAGPVLGGQGARRPVRPRRAHRGARGPARRRPRARAAAPRRAGPLRAVPRRRRPVRGRAAWALSSRSSASGPMRAFPTGPTTATLASISPPASGSSWRRGNAPSWEPASRSRFPRATPGSSSRARVSPRSRGWSSSTRRGSIDSGYRGEIRVVLLNTDLTETFVAEPGERIAQLVVLPIPELAVREVEELPPSERGERGFGSSQPGP